MADVASLALPFFGLIFLGYLCGKLVRLPEAGLAWMNFYIIYIALPALFYNILAKTPLEQLANVPFVVGTTLATYCAFAITFAIVMWLRRGRIPEATVAGIAGAYGNIGYMGPGIALATLGPGAALPVALIFCFDNILLFTLAPLMMALAGTERRSALGIMAITARKIITHPFIIATILGVIAAAWSIRLPDPAERLLTFLQNSAAPCALFVLGVTVALRPFEKMTLEVPVAVAVKLLVHPLLVLLFLSILGHFDPVWVYAALLLAALPPALNVFIIARQYDSWVQNASSSVLVGTIISVVTLTAVMYLVKTGAMPYDLFP